VAPVIGVLALQGDVVEHLQMLSALGARSVTVRRPDELAAVDALVIPGGESTTMWKLAVAFDMAEPLRKRISGGMPAFGSCAGMIMLADRLVDGVEGQETLGGINMTVRRNAFGRQVDSFESEVPLEGIAGPPALRIAPYSSGRRGWRRWAARWWCLAPSARPVGSSRSGRGRCLPSPSIPN
jgi:pyridoxal 5'-phosphate synthase pdxT subunit